MAIPALIFQTWKSKTNIPADFAYWMRSLDQFNPSFSHLLWDDDDNRGFVAAHFPWFLPVYNAYPKEIYRADAVRYFFLYFHGGLYADMDVECLKPLDGLLQSDSILFGRMGPDPDFPGSVPNAIMASPPRQEFWLFVMWHLLSNGPDSRAPELVTGPVLLKTSLDLYLGPDRAAVEAAVRSVCERLSGSLQPTEGRSSIRLLPSHEWFPLDWTDPTHQRLRRQVLDGNLLSEELKRALFPRSSMVTYWSHTWGLGT